MWQLKRLHYSGSFNGSQSGVSFEKVILTVGALHPSLISIMVSIVVPFLLHIRLLIESSINIVIILSRVVVSHRELHLLSFLDEVFILS